MQGMVFLAGAWALRRRRRRPVVTLVVTACIAVLIAVDLSGGHGRGSKGGPRPGPAASGSTTIGLFDPDVNAVLPGHRVVAFYGVPGAAATGPAWTLDQPMLDRL